jgi:hypothetical protein
MIALRALRLTQRAFAKRQMRLAVLQETFVVGEYLIDFSITQERKRSPITDCPSGFKDRPRPSWCGRSTYGPVRGDCCKPATVRLNSSQCPAKLNVAPIPHNDQQ